MTDPSENVVLCEGYYDRAFWAGWLLHLGCVDLRVIEQRPTGKRKVLDPWGGDVEGGAFGFRAKDGTFRANPAVPRQARSRSTHPYTPRKPS